MIIINNFTRNAFIYIQQISNMQFLKKLLRYVKILKRKTIQI